MIGRSTAQQGQEHGIPAVVMGLLNEVQPHLRSRELEHQLAGEEVMTHCHSLIERGRRMTGGSAFDRPTFALRCGPQGFGG